MFFLCFFERPECLKPMAIAGNQHEVDEMIKMFKDALLQSKYSLENGRGSKPGVDFRGQHCVFNRVLAPGC